LRIASQALFRCCKNHCTTFSKRARNSALIGAQFGTGG